MLTYVQQVQQLVEHCRRNGLHIKGIVIPRHALHDFEQLIQPSTNTQYGSLFGLPLVVSNTADRIVIHHTGASE